MPATPFLGRTEELASVVTHLGSADVRLLTLTGAGGWWKTRLALQSAAEVAERFWECLLDLAQPAHGCLSSRTHMSVEIWRSSRVDVRLLGQSHHSLLCGLDQASGPPVLQRDDPMLGTPVARKAEGAHLGQRSGMSPERGGVRLISDRRGTARGRVPRGEGRQRMRAAFRPAAPRAGAVACAWP